MDKIDILLATYNGEKYLKEQIDSLLNQTYQNFSLIISDDASTDATKDILKKYEKLDKRIKVYFQERNLGYVKNFEFLLKHVNSKYYMLCDQDDIWQSDKVKKTYKRLIETGSDLVFCDLELVDEQLHNISDSFCKYKGFYKKIIKDKEYKGLYLNNYVTGCTILSKQEFINKILPIPTGSKQLIHDYWIPLVISQTGKLSFIKEPLIKYRQHNNNEIGMSMKSATIETLDEIRNMFISIKINQFNIFQENSDMFKNDLRKTTKSALKYFQELEHVKYINFKNWFLYYKLYKYENFRYIISNFVILNMPIVARIIFKLKRVFINRI